jgi:hypothetical protein
VGLCLRVSAVGAQTPTHTTTGAGAPDTGAGLPDQDSNLIKPTILIPGEGTALTSTTEDEARQYVNVFMFLNGVSSSTIPYQLSGPNSTINEYSGWGAEFGGGVNVLRQVKNGNFDMSYQGSYTRFNQSNLRGGTTQTLFAVYDKRLTKRLALEVSGDGVYTINDASTFTILPSQPLFPATEPYSRTTLLTSSSVTLSYSTTKRLTYCVGGNYFDAVYKPVDNGGYFGAAGLACASYRLKKLTTLTASYTHSSFDYVRSDRSRVDAVALTLSDRLTQRWQVGISGGVSRVDFLNTIVSSPGPPENPFLGTNSASRSYSPTITASIYGSWRTTKVTATAGEGISGGNGVLLTSQSVFGSASATHEFRRFSLSGRGTYSWLTSASTVSQKYSSGACELLATYKLNRHSTLVASYENWVYPTFRAINGLDSHRLRIGITFASRNYPLPF